MIEIIQTMPGTSDFKLFEDFPRNLYPAYSVRFKLPETVPAEFLDACFVLTSNGKPQARAALYNNPALHYQNKKCFCVGNYESTPDFIMSAQLLKKISDTARSKGGEFLIGPMNGSTWDNYRFSVHHHNPSFFLEQYHHLYYNEQFTDFGFRIISSYFSSIDTSLAADNAAVLKRQQELLDAGVTFHTLDIAHYEDELSRLYDFNTVAFKSNFLYTPITRQQFIEKYTATKKIIDPEFVLLAEDGDKNLIGYIFCVNNFFNLNAKSLIIKTVARHPDKKWSGLGHVLGNLVYGKAAKLNYQSAIHAFVIEEGTSTKLSKNFSGTIYKNYALYGKEIN